MHTKKNKSISCQLCHAEFTRVSSLMAHQRVHSGEKPFQCQACEKRFAKKHDSVVHMKNSHTIVSYSEKPFACDGCKRRFTRKSSLSTHQRGRCKADSIVSNGSRRTTAPSNRETLPRDNEWTPFVLQRQQLSPMRPQPPTAFSSAHIHNDTRASNNTELRQTEVTPTTFTTPWVLSSSSAMRQMPVIGGDAEAIRESINQQRPYDRQNDSRNTPASTTSHAGISQSSLTPDARSTSIPLDRPTTAQLFSWFEAARYGQANTIAKYLSWNHMYLNELSENHETALHISIKQSHWDVAAKFIVSGADVTIMDHQGNTPLHNALEEFSDNVARKDVVMLLLNNGANLWQANNIGETPLHLAIRNNNLPMNLVSYMVSLLRNKGCTGLRGTYLHYTVRFSTPAVTKLLIDKDVNVNAPDKWGVRALHLACRLCKADQVECLLASPTPVQLLDDEGRSGLHHLLRSWPSLQEPPSLDAARIAKLLVQHGTNPNEPDKFGKTALQFHFSLLQHGKPVAAYQRAAIVALRMCGAEPTSVEEAHECLELIESEIDYVDELRVSGCCHENIAQSRLELQRRRNLGSFGGGEVVPSPLGIANPLDR